MQVLKDGEAMMGLVDYATYDDMATAIRRLDDSEFRNPFDKTYIRVKEDKGDRDRDHSPRARGRRSHSVSRSPSRSRSRSRSLSRLVSVAVVSSLCCVHLLGIVV